MVVGDLLWPGCDAFVCPVCGDRFEDMGPGVGACPECLRTRWTEARDGVRSIHRVTREELHLPSRPPRNDDGLTCRLCPRECRMGEGEEGYCGVRRGTGESFRADGRRVARASYYQDPLPTNCVADWVCAGGTGAGHPRYAHDRGPEAGFYNLAVFFEACNFNCLYCQNWCFKEIPPSKRPPLPVEHLVEAVHPRTSCICFFGGDPTPQLPYALRVAREARRKREGILRICWETNGTVHPAWLKRMAQASLESGGCVKVDLKAWHPRIHEALCGFDNRRVLENFERLARWAPLRREPPLLVASTLMVPGYVDAEEVGHLARFIARLDPDIPYALLAFAPQFVLHRFPTTSREQARECLDAARKAGLRRVRLGNPHLLG